MDRLRHRHRQRPRDGDDRVRQRLRYEQGTVSQPVRLRPRRRRAATPLRPAGAADRGGRQARRLLPDGIRRSRDDARPRRTRLRVRAKGCTEHRGCRLHVAFHGCLQNADAVGDAFYGHAGYNEWAEANDIVVLYPQAAPVLRRLIGMPLEWPNPEGCWDWWGFTGADFATKSGAQISAVSAMIDRLSCTAAVSGSSAPGSSCAPASGG